MDPECQRTRIDKPRYQGIRWTCSTYFTRNEWEFEFMKSGAQFHEGIASSWTDGYRSGGFRKRLRVFRDIIKTSVAGGSTWLDLGCGSGVLTAEILACRPDAVIAVDGAPTMLRLAKDTIGKHPGSESVDWHLSDVGHLPFVESGKVDGVLCSSVIEYLSHPDEAVLEMRRVLKKGGRLLISVPITSAAVRRSQKVARRAAGLIGVDLFPYLGVSRFDIPRDGAASFFEPHGFRVLRELHFDPIIPPSIQRIVDPSLLVVVCEAR